MEREGSPDPELGRKYSPELVHSVVIGVDKPHKVPRITPSGALGVPGRELNEDVRHAALHEGGERPVKHGSVVALRVDFHKVYVFAQERGEFPTRGGVELWGRLTQQQVIYGDLVNYLLLVTTVTQGTGTRIGGSETDAHRGMRFTHSVLVQEGPVPPAILVQTGLEAEDVLGKGLKRNHVAAPGGAQDGEHTQVCTNVHHEGALGSAGPCGQEDEKVVWAAPKVVRVKEPGDHSVHGGVMGAHLYGLHGEGRVPHRGPVTICGIPLVRGTPGLAHNIVVGLLFRVALSAVANVSNNSLEHGEGGLCRHATTTSTYGNQTTRGTSAHNYIV